MIKETQKLLEKEITDLKLVVSGLGKAFSILKRDGVEDEHLRELYKAFDLKLKGHEYSLGLLKEAYEKENKKASAGK